MNKNNLEVSLTKELCPICVKEMDGPIVMNTKLTKEAANEVRELQGKAIGMSKTPCDDCKEMMKQGFIFIGVVKAKSEDPSNPYRSGNIWCIKKEAVAELMGEDSKTYKDGVAFIDVNDAVQLGLPEVNTEA